MNQTEGAGIIEDINEQIQSLISEGEDIAARRTRKRSDGSYYISGDRYRIWLERVAQFLRVNFPDEDLTREVSELKNSRRCQNQHTYERIKGKLMALIEFPPQQKFANNSILVSILTHFDKYVNRLQNRRNNKPLYEFKDEADVQDSLHAVLSLFYSDIRAEDHVSEFAGGTSRVDFFLPEIQSVIEVKYARKSLKDNELGKQLLVDIGRYGQNRECKILFLFIFDPFKVLRNSAGLISDLEKKSTSDMAIKVIVSPS